MRRWIYRPDNASGRARTSAFIVSWIIYSRSCTRSALSHSPPVSTSVITCTPVFVRGVLLETRSFQAECPRRPVSVTIYFPIMRILQPRGQASLHQPDTKGCKGSKWITDLLFHHWLSLQCTTFHPLSFPCPKPPTYFSHRPSETNSRPMKIIVLCPTIAYGGPTFYQHPAYPVRRLWRL